MAELGYVGLGVMGRAIVRRLLDASHEVTVWNRTREKAEPLGEAGAVVCETPAGAASGAAFVLTTVADAGAVAETMEGDDGALGAMEDDAVWLQLATVGVAAADRLRELAAGAGVAFVDAPVLGTRKPAEQGELVVLASGPADARDRCAAVFDAIGKETRWVGEAGAGSRLKMVTNAWLLSVMEAAAEAIALAEGLGIDPREFLGTMDGSQIDTPYLHIKGEAILERELAPSFKLRLAEKDARLVLAAGEQAGIDLALARAAHDKFARAVELGHGDEDMAATYFASAPG